MATTVLNEAQMSILRLLGSLKTVEEVKELRHIMPAELMKRLTSCGSPASGMTRKTNQFWTNICAHHTHDFRGWRGEK